MLPGPVFEYELLTTARRWRYHAARVGYGLLLLLVLWQIYEMWSVAFGRVLTPSLVSRFTHAMFLGLTILQEVLVLVLTPALVAGVIASEKQGKTLHYVMASPLGSLEIVLGKLASRMLHVMIFLGVGLPISSMLVLLGGVDSRLVLFGTAVCVSTAFFLASLSVLVSVYARSVREALFLAMSLELLWLIVPELIYNFLPKVMMGGRWVTSGGGVPDSLLVLEDWLRASSPLSVARVYLFAAMWGGPILLDGLGWMAEIQAVAGVVLLLLAAARLRPVYRKQMDGRPASGKGGWAWRHGRPPCGDDPMAWKERHPVSGGVLSRVVALLVTVAIGLPIGYGVWKIGGPAFIELAWAGYPPMDLNWWDHYRARSAFFAFIHVALIPLFLVGLLAVVAAGAASVTAEHEADTWVSLTATDLQGSEIVRAKRRGALRASRLPLMAMALLVSLGVISGALHPLSLPALTVAVGTFYVFAAVLGVWVSFQFHSTWRAQFFAVAMLTLINLSGQAALSTVHRSAFTVLPGFMPVQVSRCLFERNFLVEIAASWKTAWGTRFHFEDIDTGSFWTTAIAGGSVVLYMAFGLALHRHTLRRFEWVAGRAMRPRPPRVASGPGTAVETVVTTISG